MRYGDKVRLVAVPPDVEAIPEERDDMGTREVFRRCVGRVFTVRGVGTNGSADQAELWVRDGKDDWNVVTADSIWVEPEHLELARPGATGARRPVPRRSRYRLRTPLPMRWTLRLHGHPGVGAGGGGGPAAHPA